MSVDRKIKPTASPYIFGKDNPLIYVDPDGNDDFYFNSVGELEKSTRRSAWHNFWFGHRVYFQIVDGEYIEAKMQDQNTDATRYHGELVEKRSDWRDKLPAVKQCQLVPPHAIKNVVEGNYTSILMDEPSDVRQNIYEYTKKEGAVQWLDENSNQLDYGLHILNDATSYVVQLADEYVAMNAQNFGNFLYGVAFQQMGFTAEQSKQIGNFWNMAQHGEWDSLDDQEAIEMGWKYGKDKYGNPRINRSLQFYLDLDKHVETFKHKSMRDTLSSGESDDSRDMSKYSSNDSPESDD